MTTNNIDIPRIETEDLKAHVKHDGAAGTFTILLTGSAESAAMSVLDTMLKRVHLEATRHGVRQIVVDLRDLEFMNSSCFKAFVSWLGELQDTDEARQYKIKFLSDETKHWQRRSLGALSCFAVDLITIET